MSEVEPAKTRKNLAKEQGLSMLQSQVLDLVAQGKTPRQIGELVGIPASEAAKMAYTLLDQEVMTDQVTKRKIQLYRLEKIVDALWEKTLKHTDKDDVRNLTYLLEKINELLGLNQEMDKELALRMTQIQFQQFMQVFALMMQTFREMAKDIPEEEWIVVESELLDKAQEILESGNADGEV